jgi:hypothetical protein
MTSNGRLQLTLISETTYGPCIWFIKLSLFVFFLELFGRLRWLRYMAVTGMIVTGLFYWATLIVFAAMCAPMGSGPQSQMSYLQALASAKCEDSRPLTVVTGVVNVVSDLYLILLPLPAVWSLNLPLRKKLGVSMIFLTGFMSDSFFPIFEPKSLISS